MKEIPHKKLTGDPAKSGRYVPIGHVIDKEGVVMTLVDKIIYPINKCPHCKSLKTFHRRIQESGDLVGNVFNVSEHTTLNGYYYSKFDYCLDCHHQFLIEAYIWKITNKNIN